MLFWHRQLCIVLMNNARNCCCIANSTNSSFSSDWQFSMNRLHHQPFHIAKKSMARVLEIVWKIDKIHNVFKTLDSSNKTILKLSYSPFVFSCCDNWLFVKHHFLPVKIYKSTSKLKHFLNEPFHTNQLIDPKWLQEKTQSVKKPSKIASKSLLFWLHLSCVSSLCSRIYECYTSIIGPGGGLIPLPSSSLHDPQNSCWCRGARPVADAQLFDVQTRILVPFCRSD